MSALPPSHLWGVQAAIEPIGGGHRNAVFRTSGLKRDLVFKSTRRTEAALSWLTPVMEAAEAAGFTVPRLIPALDGALMAAGWTCEPYLEGRPFAPENIPKVAAQIERFHRKTHSLPQRPGFLSSPDLMDATQGGDVDLMAMPAEIIALCRRAWQPMQGEIGVIHGDLNAGNLIHSEHGPALIDWDEARVDLRAYDLIRTHPEHATAAEKTAALAWEVACSWGIEPDHARICAQVLQRRI
ncbi:phosphotransferase [Celeribacter baekdonensis]|uniref:Aminoglycoside phosphotransferase n=1 Tax=Celeribacter baekdonensis TaxID=875171 RepID=A0A2R4M258_9RHOB|nr:phosphotransferase [Celeribacter baekdonensis]AVW91226.1 aminoglycoside phosphotransferase [Celeribacter baekdonensis]|tara:strand:- start:68383 stop:69102 length:720 start_codon:yes stop_codon:yes gene_type:complete